MSGFLAGWPIRRRVALGLGLIALCLLATGAVAIDGFSRVTAAFEVYRTAAAERDAAERLRVEVAALTGDAKEYVARNTEERRISTVAAAERTAGALSAARASAPDAAFRAAADDAASALAAFASTFETAADLRERRNAIVAGDLRAAGTSARAALEQSSNAAAAAGDEAGARALMGVALRLMLARDYANRFLDGFDGNAMERARQEIAAAIASLAPAAAGGAAGTAIETFAAGLDGLAQVLGEERAATRALFDDRVAALDAATHAMVAAAVDHEGAASAAFVAAKGRAIATATAVTAFALALATLVGIVLSSSIVGPVRAMTAAMREIAGGALDTPVPGTRRGDEVGAMAAAVEVFRDNAVERRRLEAERVRASQAARQRQDEIDQMVSLFGKSMAHTLKGFNGSASQMSATARAMQDAARDAAEKAGTVASAAGRMEGSIQTIASAAQELTGSIAEVGQQAERTSRMSKSVREGADGAEADVGELVAATRQIGGIITLIREISEQTNLLALNATIEAARAGAAGKGFAVVAAEVKQLAEQTGKATDRITESLAGVEGLSAGAVAAMGRMKADLAGLDEIAEAVAAAAFQQRSATEEIARSAAATLAEVSAVTGQITGVSDATATTGDQATAVNGAADELAENADALSVEVQDFLAGIGDRTVREAIRKRAVRLAAEAKADGRSFRCTLIAMSPAAGELEGLPRLAPGSRVILEVDGCGTIRGRVADPGDRRTTVQFSMEREELERRERFLLSVAGGGSPSDAAADAGSGEVVAFRAAA